MSSSKLINANVTKLPELSVDLNVQMQSSCLIALKTADQALCALTEEFGTRKARIALWHQQQTEDLDSSLRAELESKFKYRHPFLLHFAREINRGIEIKKIYDISV